MSKIFLSFVQGTKTHGIHYVAQSSLELVHFTNSDWESDNTNINSAYAYVFMLAYGTINFSSKKQSAIALSSTDAEYRGAVNATTQCLWLRGILGECGIESETSTIIYYENKSTIQISIDPIQRQ